LVNMRNPQQCLAFHVPVCASVRKTAAAIQSLLTTTKLNGRGPYARFKDTLGKTPDLALCPD